MSKLPKRPHLAASPPCRCVETFISACLDYALRHGRLISRLTPLDDLDGFLATCRLASRAATATGPAAEAALVRAQGAALARKGEQLRDIVALGQAAETFRWAAKLFGAAGNPADASRAALGAVEALTRQAEMTHDLGRLRLALALHRHHFSDREALLRIGLDLNDLARVDCCRCVALIRAGDHGADPHRVAAAWAELRGWAGAPGLDRGTRRQVALLLVATSCAKARQSGTAGDWEAVQDWIRQLRPDLRRVLADADMHHYRAVALHELGRINRSATTALRSATLHGELAVLYARHGLGWAAARSWHGRGGALLTAYDITPDADERLANSAREALLAALGFFSEGRNAQEWLRVQADLAEVAGLRARRARDMPAALSAADEFERALDAVSVETSPVLFIRVARLLFYHRCASGLVAEAAATFEEMMAAQAIVLSDPRSSHSVYLQSLREMRDTFDLAAWCLCRLGRPAEAAAVLDAGRARELTMKLKLLGAAPAEAAAASALSDFEVLAPHALVAEGMVVGAENGASLAAQRWAAFVRSRRAVALAAAERRGLPALPGETASVHVSMCEFGSYAIVAGTGCPGGHIAISLEGAHMVALRQLAARSPPSQDDSSWDARYRRLLADVDPKAEIFRRERSGTRDVRCTRSYSAFNDFLLDVLRLLWAALMGPVSDAFAVAGVEREDVVVVCLPASLLKLPVLAATSDEGLVFNHAWKATLAPSLSIALRSLELARERTSDGTGKLLVVSDPRAGPSDPGEVTFGAAEASAIAALAGDRPVVALSGERATAAEVMRHMSDCEIFHAACHGSYVPGSPAESGLEVANDARITISSIWHAPRLMRRARLCFLSACESGLTEPGNLQDEFVGLAAGLIGAGSPAVICTLWPVYEDASTEVGIAFYRRLLSSGQHWSAPESSLRSGLAQFRLSGWRETVVPAASVSTRIRARSRDSGPDADGESDLVVTRRLSDCPYEWAGYVLFGV